MQVANKHHSFSDLVLLHEQGNKCRKSRLVIIPGSNRKILSACQRKAKSSPCNKSLIHCIKTKGKLFFSIKSVENTLFNDTSPSCCMTFYNSVKHEFFLMTSHHATNTVSITKLYISIILHLFFLLLSVLSETCYGQKSVFDLKTALSTLLPKAEIHSKSLVTMTCISVHCLTAKLLAVILISALCYKNVFILISGKYETCSGYVYVF